MRVLRVLRRPHLAILWAGQVLSAIGDVFYSIAIVWIAVQAVGSSAGVVAATQSGATLLAAPLGGILADRLDRRRAMIGVDLARALIVVTLPIAAWLARITLPHLIAVAVGLGVLTALFTPALQASLPALASNPDELQATNGLMDATLRLARAVGPSITGVLAAQISVPNFFTIDALSFGASALAIAALGRRFDWKPAGEHSRSGLIREVAGAVQLIRGHRPLAWAFAGLIVANTAWFAAFIVGGALFASDVLRGDVGTYGALVSAYGVGNIASNLVFGSLSLRRVTPFLFLGHAVVGFGFVLLSLAPTLPLALGAAALAAIGGPIGDLALLSVIQNELPRAQLGKVFSLRMCVEYGGSSAGLLIAAPLFALLPVRLGIAACATAILSFGLLGLVRFWREPRPPG